MWLRLRAARLHGWNVIHGSKSYSPVISASTNNAIQFSIRFNHSLYLRPCTDCHFNYGNTCLIIDICARNFIISSTMRVIIASLKPYEGRLRLRFCCICNFMMRYVAWNLVTNAILVICHTRHRCLRCVMTCLMCHPCYTVQALL